MITIQPEKKGHYTALFMESIFLVSGILLENTVFLELKRRNCELYYYENHNECDFLIKKGTKIVSAIQVSSTLQNPETRKREITGLQSAMKQFGSGSV